MYLTETLKPKHEKSEFSCGNPLFDTYIRKQANQDIKRKLSACFVLSDKESQLIKGYYTLSNNSIPQEYIPEAIQKKPPKSYLSIPTTLLGRLAIDKRYQSKGVGKLLLIDALKRSYDLSKNIGSFAIIVDPVDSAAEAFYNKYGFIKLPDSKKMFLPTKTIGELFD